nr:NADH dehydrogenase subunit 5 [Aptinothrips stylifer]
MFPFFFLLGLNFLFFSFFMITYNLSFFIQWDLLSGNFKISFPIFLDFMACIFLSVVLLISSSILYYSEFYMKKEMYKGRFIFLMMMFVVSMVLLIVCPNLFLMLMGWDGLGLTSYCLVIYYQNYKSYNAGMLTVLTNRIGDVFILMSIAFLFDKGSWTYMNMIFLNMYDLSFIIFFLMIAAMTKSAQIPFSAWLPAAMAAPTPVSSLVHSSTLVTAGVYLLIRTSYMMQFSLNMRYFLFSVGVLTTIMAGMGALYEFDMKKIIALSTLSQLGFMVSSVSLNLIDMAFFHLIMHACFKALLFMCAGVFIHKFGDVQDIRGFGFMNKNVILTICMFNIANLSLSGLPFLSGFFSKDLILEYLLNMFMLNILILLFFIFGAMLTVLYSFRLVIFLSLKSIFYFNSLEENMKNLFIHKSMFFLLLLSVISGYFSSKQFFFPYNYIVLPLFLKLMVLSLCLLMFFLILLFMKFFSEFMINKNFIMFFSSMWFLYFLKTDFFKMSILKIGNTSLKLSLNWIEEFFGMKLILMMFSFSSKLNKLMKKTIFIVFFLFLFSLLMLIYFLV